jgi:hypothetical protein
VPRLSWIFSVRRGVSDASPEMSAKKAYGLNHTAAIAGSQRPRIDGAGSNLSCQAGASRHGSTMSALREKTPRKSPHFHWRF